MAAQEDKKFDAVLGGFLVNDQRIRAGDLHCPESDTLAAYHERSLLPDEMNAWKEHIVGCARCQAILADLEATDSIPLQASEKEEVLTVAVAPVGGVGKTSSAREEVRATVPRSRVTSISRGVRWQWLAPAGALAAGLLIWIAWHENRSQVNAPAEVKTARLEPPAASPPPVTRDGREAVSSDEIARISKDQTVVAGAPAGSQAESLKQVEKSDSRAKIALAKPIPGEIAKALESSRPPADKEAGARADTALDSLSAAKREQNQPAQDAKAGAAGALSQTVEVQAPTANAQPQNQQAQQNLQAQQNQLNEQKASGPNPSRHAEQAKKSKAESPTLAYRTADAAPTSPPPAPAAAFNDSAVRLAATISQNLIASPGGKNLWRVSHLGMIEFSSDSGASWSRQASNVSADLTAGSAPSEKVCWIVGQAGTILLTTDAGAHWVIIHSPLNENLTGVRATDALHATIWSLTNMKVFGTSDGGTNWKPVQAR